MPTLLLVDDEANIRASLSGALGREDFDVETAASVAEGRKKLADSFDFALLDVWFPDGSGLDLLRDIAERAPHTVVVMMSGHATIDVAVEATRLGAFDFLEKPVSLERLLVVLRNATAARALREENRRLRAAAWSSRLVGDSPAMNRLREEIELAGPTTARVLIQGEHGTGKELVAAALHAASPRRAMPFVAVNCAAIPEELIESELFGHERGAFTGATGPRRGRFEEAHGGTLFLDEVGDLSPRAQTKLLRVLQEGEFQRVGGNRTIKVDVRVIAATNRDLVARAKDGAFREDLYFRLAVVPIVTPPLRDRVEDIAALVEHFSAQIAAAGSGKARHFTNAALDVLRGYDFPGNVRELRNLVERLIIMVPSGNVGPNDVTRVFPGIAAAATAAEGAGRLADAVDAFERTQIEAALAAMGGNVARAATRLGLERSHLYKKMKKLGLG